MLQAHIIYVQSSANASLGGGSPCLPDQTLEVGPPHPITYQGTYNGVFAWAQWPNMGGCSL